MPSGGTHERRLRRHRTMKRFYVMLDDQGDQRHPMKPWLCQNPHVLPEDCDSPDSKKNSHQLRDALNRNDWAELQTLSEVLLAPPGVA